MKKALMIMIVSFYSYGQQSKIDSLKVILATSKIDTIKLNTYNAIITQYAGSDINLAEKYLDSMFQLSRKTNSKRHELTAYTQEGILNFRQGKIKESVEIWKKGLADKQINNYPKQKSNFLNNIAVGFKAFKEKDSVLKYLSAGIKLNEEQKNDIGLVGNYYSISDFYFQVNEFDKSIAYLTKLQSVALKTGDKQAFARTNILLASISRKEYDFPDAIDYFNQALIYYKENEPNNHVMIRGLKYEVIKTKLRQKKYEESIVELKKLKKDYGNSPDNNRVFWLEVDIDLLDSYNNTSNINEGFIIYQSLLNSNLDIHGSIEAAKLATLSKFEILSDRINSNTLTHLRQSYNLAKDLEMGDQLLSITELFVLYHLKKNNNKLAFEFFNDARIIRDSLSFSESKIINLSQKRKFNEALKDKENQILKKQNAEQALLTEKQKNQKLVIGSGLVISVAALVIFFIAYQKNKKQKKEIEKQKNLIEKLQRELHHRLKNNLSFIDFFITLAKGKFQDPAYVEKLDELQNRINSMFEIHRQLFKKEDVTNVNAKTYISALLEKVKNAYSNPNISLIENVENINLRADTSFPIGLIVNEFVTNSYKYAFPNDEPGVISISFNEDVAQYHLQLSDTGKGLPSDFDIDSLDSFGMETIKLLTQEYKGTFKLDGSNGLKMEICFPKAS